MLMLHRKRRVSRENIIVIIGILVILMGFVFFNFERINLFLKGYSFSEQSVILNLDDETVKRFLNNSELIDIKSWNDIDNDKHYLEYQKYQEYKKQLSKKEVIGYIDTFYDKYYKKLIKIIYVFLTIFLYLLKCPQSLILSALRAFCFCGKPHISRSIFLYFRYQAWLKSW